MVVKDKSTFLPLNSSFSAMLWRKIVTELQLSKIALMTSDFFDVGFITLHKTDKGFMLNSGV